MIIVFYLNSTPYVKMIHFHFTSTFISLMFSAVMVAPIVHFLLVGWRYKSNDILTTLPTEAKKQYLALYQQKACASIDDALKNFEDYYWKWYGRRHLVAATIIVASINVLICYLIGESAMRWITKDPSFVKMPEVAIAGFIGGYIFVAWDFIDRNARRDLSSSDIYRGALRLSTAIAIGWAFGKLANASLAPFIAFAVGVFPLPTVQMLLRRLANKQLQLESDPVISQDSLIKVAGISSDISDQIRDADILTISQLAYCDPIQLAMHSNLGFNFVNDIVSQSLAWIYLDYKIDILRSFGLRGACEIQYYTEDLLNSSNKEVQNQALAQLKEMSAATNTSEIALRSCFEQIAFDPYTNFLVKAYGEAEKNNNTV